MTTTDERLDALPFGRRHLRLLTGSGLGWALDAMDVGLISFILAALKVHWEISAPEAGLLTSIGFVGMAVGASLGGLLADRLGRRQVFAITLLVYGLATGASALVGGLVALMLLRFVVGLGLGAELPVASTYMSEIAPARVRGRVVVWLEAFWALGWLAAAVIGTLVVGGSENGWRWAFVIGAVPAFYALFVRWGMPESPRWLAARGRVAEAEAVVDSLAGTRGAISAPPAASAPAATTVKVSRATKVRVRDLLGSNLRRSTVLIWTVWFMVNFAYYGAFIWIPSILVQQGFTLVTSFEYTLVITLAQLPGYAVAAWLVEVWGRRATLATFLAGSAISAMLFGGSDQVATIITFGCLLSFFNLGAWGALYAVTPELYPTEVRASGAGSAAGIGRIASILTPLFTPWALGVMGVLPVFSVFATAFAIAVIAALMLPETSARARQAVSAPPSTVTTA